MASAPASRPNNFIIVREIQQPDGFRCRSLEARSHNGASRERQRNSEKYASGQLK